MLVQVVLITCICSASAAVGEDVNFNQACDPCSIAVFMLVDCANSCEEVEVDRQQLQDFPQPPSGMDSPTCSHGSGLVPAALHSAYLIRIMPTPSLTLFVEDCARYLSPPVTGPFEPPRSDICSQFGF